MFFVNLQSFGVSDSIKKTSSETSIAKKPCVLEKQKENKKLNRGENGG